MWKEYSLNYLKKNKSTAAFIVIAVFVASMFISLLSSFSIICGQTILTV